MHSESRTNQNKAPPSTMGQGFRAILMCIWDWEAGGPFRDTCCPSSLGSTSLPGSLPAPWLWFSPQSSLASRRWEGGKYEGSTVGYSRLRCPLPLALVRGRRALLLLGYKAQPCRIPTPCLQISSYHPAGVCHSLPGA